MLTCPMCKKCVDDMDRQCPRCSADLSLLVNFMTHVRAGLERAEARTRQGQLDEAVWCYLEVLEADPENSAARQQVGRVAAAVRQFDRNAPKRRWLARLGRRERFRRWLDDWSEKGPGFTGIYLAAGAALLAICFALGYYVGYHAGQRAESAETANLVTR